MSPLDDPAIPKGSIALVTGVNGLVGSHVADKFLEFGYVVRGTVRDTKKSDWLTTVFDNKYGKNKFELVSIPDMKIDGAFDEAAKGVSAVVHVATVNSFDPDPLNVIPPTISGALNAIRAASRLAWGGLPLSVPEQAGITYAASKTQSEQEVWKFHNENKEKRPDLVVNTILPNLNFGQSLDIVNQGYPSTSGFIVHLWRGENLNLLKFFPPQWFVDVQDVGLLHVAASIHRDVKGERIFGFAETTNWDKVLAILRKHNPEMKFIDDFQGEQDLSEIKPRARAEQLLRDLGRPGWTSLEDSILANTEGLRGDGPAWTNLGQTQVLKIDQLTPAT